ncbi:MAG: helix-turn-helix transcriptional regulator [Hyphomonas sp.]
MTSTTMEMLTSHDVAALLKVSKATVYRMTRQGLLPRPQKFGRSSRWKRQEIEQALDSAPRAA